MAHKAKISVFLLFHRRCKNVVAIIVYVCRRSLYTLHHMEERWTIFIHERELLSTQVILCSISHCIRPIKCDITKQRW